VLFHDGTPLTAEAVQINFETQLANPLVGLSLGPYFPAEGASAVVDDRTIEYSMLEPNAVFPAWLTSQLGMVASPTWLAAATEDATLNQEPVGTGPFVFDSRTPGSQTRVVRNDAWWGGEVYLDAVEFWTVADPADRADLLLGGELNGLHTTDPATVGELTADDSLQNIIDETGEEQFVMLNTTAAPFDDARARQALALSAPLDTYRQLIGLGIARGADQMFIPESKYYNPAVVQQGDDPDAAAALAAEYCAEVPDNCSDGRIDIEFQHTGPSVVASREADILAQGWGAAFNVAFDELVQDEHIQQVVFGQYEAAMWRQFGSLEPALNRHVLMCRTVGEGLSLNFPRFCSEERDALILDAQAQVDPAARIPDWQAVVQDMNDAFTYVFLLHTIWDTALASSVRGVCERTSPEGVPPRCAVNGVSWFDSAWIDG
jgi:ABC-type transport system substrate-binding protein